MTTIVQPGSVVVGVDGSTHSDAAVEWAADYAVAHHAPLCLLHAAGDLGDNLIPFKVDAREMQAKASHPITDRASAASAWRISARVLPTPEKTTRAGSPPAASTRSSSPPETMSKPQPGGRTIAAPPGSSSP